MFLLLFVFQDINILTSQHFPDPHFRQVLAAHFNYFLSPSGANEITELVLNDLALTDVRGLEQFANLESLSLQNNQLTELSNLPDTLKELRLNGNQIGHLSNLPPHLRTLEADDNPLTTIDAFSESLTFISLNRTLLKSLPDLPQALYRLEINHSLLDQLPVLPTGLQGLYVTDNALLALPDLPENLKWFSCSANRLERLPELPQSLREMDCSKNFLTDLPALPFNLRTLDCSANLLVNLPDLPEALSILDCSHNQLTEIHLSQTLTSANVHNNYLQELTLEEGSLLQNIDASQNQFKTLDLRSAPYVAQLNLAHNQLETVPQLKGQILQLVKLNNNNISDFSPLIDYVVKGTKLSLFANRCQSCEAVELLQAKVGVQFFFHPQSNAIRCASVRSGGEWLLGLPADIGQPEAGTFQFLKVLPENELDIYKIQPYSADGQALPDYCFELANNPSSLNVSDFWTDEISHFMVLALHGRSDVTLRQPFNKHIRQNFLVRPEASRSEFRFVLSSPGENVFMILFNPTAEEISGQIFFEGVNGILETISLARLGSKEKMVLPLQPIAGTQFIRVSFSAPAMGQLFLEGLAKQQILYKIPVFGGGND